MHDDDARMIRATAINRALANLRAGGSQHMSEAKYWVGVAVIAGSDKDDIRHSLGVTAEFVEQGVVAVREHAP